MRCADRNKRHLYYANYSGLEEQLDEYGNYTGIYNSAFDEQKELYGNVSAEKGEATISQFGNELNYSLVLKADGSCPITEHSAIWYGVEPTEPYNYVVVGIAESLHFKSYALQRVDVNV